MTSYRFIIFTCSVAAVLAEKCSINVKDSTIGQSDSATLPCKLKGKAHPHSTYVNIFWFRIKYRCNEQKTYSLARSNYRVGLNSNYFRTYHNHISQVDNETILMSNVSVEDEGWYACEIRPVLSGCPKYKRFRIKIIDAPDELNFESLMDDNIAESASSVLKCSARGGYPEPVVSINRNGEEIASGKREINIKLHRGATAENATYRCTSRTMDIDEELTSRVITRKGLVHNSDDSILEFHSVPGGTTHVEHSRLIITCRLKRPSTDYGVLTIYRYGKAVTSGHRSVHTDFVVSRADHQVALFCTAQKSGETISVKLTFRVINRDHEKVHVRNSLVNLHEDVSLMCRMQTKPSNDTDYFMDWDKDTCTGYRHLYRVHRLRHGVYRHRPDTNLFYDQRLVNVSHDEVILRNVTREDEGRYNCYLYCSYQYRHTYGCGQKYYFHIKIKSKPFGVTLKLKSNGTQEYQRAGSIVQLTCIAHGGYPTPTVSIYWNDSQLVTSREHVTLHYRLDETDSLVPFVCRAKTDGLTDIVESNRKVFFFNTTPRVHVTMKTPQSSVAPVSPVIGGFVPVVVILLVAVIVLVILLIKQKRLASSYKDQATRAYTNVSFTPEEAKVPEPEYSEIAVCQIAGPP